MVGNRYDSDRRGFSYLAPEKETNLSIFDRFEAKAARFKFIFALICWVGIFFIAGVLIGETKEGNRKRSVFTEKHLKQQDSLIKVQHQFIALYRVQRTADRRLYENYFLQLANTDSVLLAKLSRK